MPEQQFDAPFGNFFIIFLHGDILWI